MAFVSVSRVARDSYDREEDVRARVDRVKNHMVDMALNAGLNPEGNVSVKMGHRKVEVGISSEMDQFLRTR